MWALDLASSAKPQQKTAGSGDYQTEVGDEELRQKIDELAMESVFHTPKPLLLSISLLGFDDCDLALEVALKKWPIGSPEHNKFLYLFTEAVVLSFSDPMNMCGMFGNDVVKSKGYSNFKSIARKLQDQWMKTFAACHEKCSGTLRAKVVQKRIQRMESFLKLLRDLNARTSRRVKAIDLQELIDVAEDHLSDMEDILAKCTLPRNPPSPAKQAFKSPTKNAENTGTAFKNRTPDAAVKKLIPFSPVNLNTSYKKVGNWPANVHVETVPKQKSFIEAEKQFKIKNDGVKFSPPYTKTSSFMKQVGLKRNKWGQLELDSGSVKKSKLDA